MVNAFALPGGYVYISRGLTALTNNEAELAGVIAHEIGHITARRTAQRCNRAVFAEIGAAVPGAVVGNQVVSQVANPGAAAYIQGCSRENEFEADQLGIRYLVRAGYDPGAMADFPAGLKAENALAEKSPGERRNRRLRACLPAVRAPSIRLRRAANRLETCVRPGMNFS